MPIIDWRKYLARKNPTARAHAEESLGSQRFHELWSALETHAWSLLENSELIDPTLLEEDGERVGTPRVRIQDSNLGVRPTSWTLFEPPERQVVWIVREALWEESRDNHDVRELVRQSRSAQAPAPTLHVRDAWVPSKPLMKYFKEANTFALPLLCRKKREATSGQTRLRTLDFLSPDDPPAQIRLQWSDRTPPEWQPVAEWLDRLKGFLMRCLTHPDCKVTQERADPAHLDMPSDEALEEAP